MSLKCPKKIKSCQPCLLVKASFKAGNFICSGVSTKPTKYNKDNIWLCSHGMLSKMSVEMTVEEALYICSALHASLGWLAPGVIKKQIKKGNNGERKSSSS